jgi:hypothetical protein
VAVRGGGFSVMRFRMRPHGLVMLSRRMVIGGRLEMIGLYVFISRQATILEARFRPMSLRQSDSPQIGYPHSAHAMRHDPNCHSYAHRRSG